MTTTATVAQPAAAPNAAEAGRYDAFISYSRHDSPFAVDVLVAQLRAAGKEVWLDLDISGGAQWLDRVDLGIEACKALIFVVTPSSVASEACRGELDGAVSLHKLVIPVIHEDVPADAMPKALADAEWVFLRDTDDRAAGMQKLVAALEADLEWRDQINGLAFGPDSRKLASASSDGTIRLWDVVSRRELGGPLTGHTGDVNAIAFNRDGTTLASGGADHTVRLWTTAPIGTYIRQVCAYIDLKRAPKLWRQAALSITYEPPC